MEVVNARIKKTSLTIEDHDILTFWLHLEWSGGGQGLGGFALDSYDRKRECRTGWGDGLIAIRDILETVGVSRWEDLAGKLIRVKHFGWGASRAPIIGHIIDDKWFDMKKFAEESQARMQAEAPDA